MRTSPSYRMATKANSDHPSPLIRKRDFSSNSSTEDNQKQDKKRTKSRKPTTSNSSISLEDEYPEVFKDDTHSCQTSMSGNEDARLIKLMTENF